MFKIIKKAKIVREPNFCNGFFLKKSLFQQKNKNIMKTNNLKYLLIILSFFLSIQIQAATIYVDIFATGSNNGTTWTDAYTDLQTAINQSTYGDIVRVSEGIYAKSSSYTLKDGVKIYGGYPNSTSVPFLAQYPHHRNFLRNPAQYITVLENTISSSHTAIIFIDYNLSNQTITDGITIKGRNGVKIYGKNSNFSITPYFNNCVFDGATLTNLLGSQAIHIFHNAQLVKPSFNNCIFTNYIEIGIVSAYSSYTSGETSPQFINCEFRSSNTGLHIVGEGANRIRASYFINCIFHDLGTAIIIFSRNPNNFSVSGFQVKIINSIFYNNSTIIKITEHSHFPDISTNFSNCSFFNNGDKAPFQKVAFSLIKSSSSSLTDTNPTTALRLENCISWNNLNTNGDLMSIDNGMYVEIENTLLEANSSLSNGTSADPIFVIPNGHPTINRVKDLGNCIYNQNPMFVTPSTTGTPNLKLQNTSPARNTGNNTLIPAGVTRAYGNNDRILESVIDMGAYEFCPWAGVCTSNSNTGGGHLPVGGLKIKQDQNQSVEDINIYPNPVKDIINIKVKKDLNVEFIKLIDIQGRVIQTWKFENSTNTTINVEKLKVGIYLLQINTNKGVTTLRFIKE